MSTIDINRSIAELGHIVVLFGGESAEREVSLQGGQAVVNGLQKLGATVTALDAREGYIEQLQKLNPDFVFNMLHGRGGEDGSVQGLLQALKLPCTGSGVLASALSMDKMKTKLLWQRLGLPTADFILLQEKSNWSAIMENLGKAVVKPVNEGSSIGMSIVSSAEALESAYHDAFVFDKQVIAEKYIKGEEFSVSIVGDEILPTVQMQTDREFYNYQAKYEDNDTRYICPAALSAEKQQELNELSLSAFAALDCSGWGRVDVMQDSAGEFYLLEVNTVPGMTTHSLVPLAAKQAGYSFEELLTRILMAARTADTGAKSES